MIYLGIDPDLHTTALALADDARVYSVMVVRGEPKLKGEAACLDMARQLTAAMRAFLGLSAGLVVEGQHLHAGGSARKMTPEDLANLAFVAGAAAAAAFATGHIIECHRPSASTWKGQIPKKIHQRKTCAKLGWNYVERADHVVPSGFGLYGAPIGADDLKPSDWKHALDAIGLARWGALHTSLERLEKEAGI